jgi:putative transposase
MAVRVEGKVADAYKVDRKTRRMFKPRGAIAYDDRILKWKLSSFSVSMWRLEGRQEILFSTGPRQLEWLKFQQGESDLVYSGGEFYLLATCEVPEPTPEDVEGYLGVDLGIANVAVDSAGNRYTGKHVNNVRHRYGKLRGKLQGKATKSAKRKLKKGSKREGRFVTNENHRIAKQLVQTAQRTRSALVLEDLKGIRKRAKGYGAAGRRKLHGWAFGQLRAFVEYKAALAGVGVVYTDPRNTSRECSCCGSVDKANRPSQAVFKCLQCGISLNADENAARVIAGRAYINRPNVAGLQS